jgi:hypothetical protein
VDKIRLRFPESLAPLGFLGLFGYLGYSYSPDFGVMRLLLPIGAVLSLFGFAFFHAQEYGLKYPERLGLLGFFGFLGFLGYFPGAEFLKALFGLFGFWFFFAFLGRRRRTTGNVAGHK